MGPQNAKGALIGLFIMGFIKIGPWGLALAAMLEKLSRSEESDISEYIWYRDLA